MNESGPRAIEQFVEELADLRRAAGSPSLREITRWSPNRKLAHSTAADALKGDRLPSLQVVLMLVDACHEFARRNYLQVDDEDFDRVKWHRRWMKAKKVSQGVAGRADNDNARLDLLVQRGDVEALRQEADTGNRSAAAFLVGLLARQGDVEALRQRADTGNGYAAERLAQLLAERGEIKELRQRADAGDLYASGRLARLLAERGDIKELRQRADAGDKYAALRLGDLSDDSGD